MRYLPIVAGSFLFVVAAQAAEISVVGLFPGKALLVVDGAQPRTYSVGDRIAEGVKMIASNHSSATFIIHGKRETIALGQYVARQSDSPAQSIAILQADNRGHFLTNGQINGTTVKMMLDTGATIVALSSEHAGRIGINYRQGAPAVVRTANGDMPVYRVKLDSVRVGDIEFHNVDAAVHEGSLPFALLGMSFLNRTDMRREGDRMTLTKRH